MPPPAKTSPAGAIAGHLSAREFRRDAIDSPVCPVPGAPAPSASDHVQPDHLSHGRLGNLSETLPVKRRGGKNRPCSDPGVVESG